MVRHVVDTGNAKCFLSPLLPICELFNLPVLRLNRRLQVSVCNRTANQPFNSPHDSIVFIDAAIPFVIGDCLVDKVS